ncbi:hypothetical protein [Microbacterium wangchenii]|uniref:hypothetical protein n=1 Tax=Microbacterium wangchenii TaxID=2541726 RepID=UPI0011C76E1A|nr:hypothetical protein [Microbacterium wangchenii]TXK16039.1 hypothetical protein FVP99_11180 [Microbacterium wangchenii]
MMREAWGQIGRYAVASGGVVTVAYLVLGRDYYPVALMSVIAAAGGAVVGLFLSLVDIGPRPGHQFRQERDHE